MPKDGAQLSSRRFFLRPARPGRGEISPPVQGKHKVVPGGFSCEEDVLQGGLRAWRLRLSQRCGRWVIGGRCAARRHKHGGEQDDSASSRARAELAIALLGARMRCGRKHELLVKSRVSGPTNSRAGVLTTDQQYFSFPCCVNFVTSPRSATFDPHRCYCRAVSKREKNMHLVLSRGFLPLVIGATMLAGGCATKDDVRAAQASADAARMQAVDARAAADHAFAEAQAAGRRADQASGAAQQAQQAANSAQSTADNAQASAQSAAASAEQARDDLRATEERTQQAERTRRVRNTRLARGERG